jgi:hypothetical protein
MAQKRVRAFGSLQAPSLPRRVRHNLGRRLRRRVFLPGDSVADAVKRTAVFLIGWGTLIALLTWGAYRRDFLHGVGDGITFAAVLFLLAVLAAPDYMRPGGRQGRHRY